MKEIKLTIPEPLRWWIASQTTDEHGYLHNPDPSYNDDFYLDVSKDREMVRYIFTRKQDNGCN